MSGQEYEVDPLERVRELWVGGVITSDQTFAYTFNQGYERLVFDNGQKGGLEYAGTYHPGDGMCHSQEDVVDNSEGTCVHCGTTLHGWD